MKIILDTHLFLWFISADKRLPLIHNDSFDRLLICQAQELDLMMMTIDHKIKQYSQINFF